MNNSSSDQTWSFEEVNTLRQRLLELEQSHFQCQQAVEQLTQQLTQETAARQQAEERLQLTLTSAQMVSWDMDLVANHVLCSPNAQAVWGIYEGTGEDFFAIIHPDDRLPMIEATERAIAGETDYFQEYRVINPTGKIRWLTSQGRVYRDETGRGVRLIGLSADVTERKYAELQLQESQRFIQQIADAMPGTLYVYDMLQQRNVYVNRQIGELLGYSPEQIQAFGDQLFPQLVHPEDFANLGVQIERLNQAQDSEVVDYEYRMRHANGEWRWLWSRNTVSTRTSDGFAHQVVGTVHDITDRKQAEAALQRRAQEVRTVVENTPDIIVRYDRALRHLYVNPSIKRALGLLPEHFIGKTGAEMGFTDPTSQVWDTRLQQVFETGQSCLFEFEFPNPEGELCSYQARLIPELVEGDQIATVLAVATDVTEYKQTETSLRQSEERVRLAMEAAQMGTWDIDLLTGNAIWSEHHFMMLGFEPTATGEASEAMWSSCLHPDDSERVIQAWQQARQAHSLYQAEYRVIRADNGQLAWLAGMGSFTYDPTGQAIRSIGVVFDITERKQAEAALKESKERFQALADNIAQLAWMADSQGSLFWYNQRWFDYTGTTFEEMQGWGWQTVHHPDHLERVVEKFRHHLESGEIWEDTFPLRGQDGSYRWFLSRAVPTRDEDGTVLHWFGTNTDITDRQQVEEILRRTAEFNAFRVSLADALRPLADPVEVQATASRLLGEYLGANRVAYFEVRGADYVVERDYVNGATTLAGGCYPIDSFGSTLLAAYCAGLTVCVSNIETDPSLSPAQRSTYAAIQIGAHIGIPLVKGGEFVAGLAVHTVMPRVWTAYEVSLAEEVAERTWVAIDRARAEAIVAADLQDTQRLRELGSRLVTEGDIQTLYQEILSAAIALTGADAGSVQILDAATQDLVLLATQGFGQPIIEHFYRVNARSHTPCGMTLRNGVRSFVDFDRVPKHEDPDGAMQLLVDAGYLSGQSTRLMTRAGKTIGMVSTHWRKHQRPSDRQLRFLDLLARQAADLIEQRQTAAEREQLLTREQAARAAADRANRIKDEFLAVLSHELRSPLNPILGWSKLLQNSKLDAAKTQQALKTIERNAKLQAELIEDLLDVSRILQGKLSLNVSSINLVSLIRAAMETVRLAAEAKSIQVEASIELDVGLVSGDATRLQQVIWNLLSNAVKFTPSGGHVHIRLERLDLDAQITVSDTGQGIAPDFLPYVFDYFRQADGATTRQFGGLGLGLAIVRHLVELHGGTVEAQSPGVDRGATFIVKLPLMSQATIIHQSDQASAPVSDLQGIHVLVVDDDPDSREFVSFVLEQAGATVLTATNAAEALTLLMQTKPTVLLSDIGMPEMDGYMLMQQVRALPTEQGGQIPAIALTAYAGEMNQQQALAAGFQQHLAKPIEPEVLVSAITTLVKSS